MPVMAGSVTSLSKNERSSQSYDSPGLSSVFSVPQNQDAVPATLKRYAANQSVPNPSLASTTTSNEVNRLASIPNQTCNPNVIIDKHPPFPTSKRGGMTRHEAEAFIKRHEGVLVRQGVKRLPPPRVIIPRQQGRIHLDGPETVHSMVPLSVKGMR